MRKHPALFAAAVVGVCLASLLSGAAAPERTPTDRSVIIHGGSPAKATVDTVTLMGPGGLYPYRGDFETADPRPGGDGLLPDGWTSVDESAPVNLWHVDAHGNPFNGLAAWCGSLNYPSCGGSDPAGGYGNSVFSQFDFRRNVGEGPATVRVQASLQYDCEPGYDFLRLQRRTATHPGLEPLAGGQGLSWDGEGIVTVDYTFTWTASELLDGTDVAVAFVFDSDAAWSDGDCLWPTDGAARLDDITVTVNGVVLVEDFEDGSPAPDWSFTPTPGIGDFARVWHRLQDRDDCAANYSKVIAFLDDGLVVPGTGGTVGRPGWDYATPGGYTLNFRGGRFPASYWGVPRLPNRVDSPVMPLPAGGASGLTLAFDVYTHNAINGYDQYPFMYMWEVRSTAGGPIAQAPWVSRNFIYYGGPAYKREVKVVDDLLVPGATAVQVSLSIAESVYLCDFGCIPETTSPAPWFDNVNVKAYPQGGPRIVANELYLAGDGFPASGALNLANLGANSVRFDMAANISPASHLRIDAGDSIWIDVTPRSGGTLTIPSLHWTFAVKNPLFTDAHRTALAPGQTSGSTVGRVTRRSNGSIVANRWNFDLPDTGMLFPGDVLHYYVTAADNVAGDVRTATVPANLAGFGAPAPGAYPGRFVVNCLPSLRDATGQQPSVLLWNDAGFGGGEDEWLTALSLLGLRPGVDFDLFNTRAPATGAGQGLGARATAAHLAGYTDLLYTSGDLGVHTLSYGSFGFDPSNDLGLLNDWRALGGRDLLLCGDDLAASLNGSTDGRAFLQSAMGVQYLDGDVRDNIGGQIAPTIVNETGNPVFLTIADWLLYGGCPTANDFDAIAAAPGAITLARFAGAGGSPYAEAAAVLNADAGGRVVTLPYDLSFVMGWDKAPMPQLQRALLLNDVLSYFGEPGSPGTVAPVPGAVAPLAVSARPNPFNPAVELRYTLARPGHLAMKVFDTRGALVRTLIDGPVATASGVIVWDGADDRGGQAASGLYFVETRADGQVDVRKVTMVK